MEGDFYKGGLKRLTTIFLHKMVQSYSGGLYREIGSKINANQAKYIVECFDKLYPQYNLKLGESYELEI